jgi:hypothetical protein
VVGERDSHSAVPVCEMQEGGEDDRQIFCCDIMIFMGNTKIDCCTMA